MFRSLAAAEDALADFARSYNYHRLHGEIGWSTPAERYDGTPSTDRGFDNVPALAHLARWRTWRPGSTSSGRRLELVPETTGNLT